MTKAKLTSNLTIMVHQVPWQFDPECMTRDAMPDEAVEKIHRFMHLRHGLPVSWLVDDAAASYYRRELAEWRENYGDEIGIYEMAVYGRGITPPGVQEWVEAAGIERPYVQPAAPGEHCVQSSKLFCQLPESDQRLAFRYLKKHFDDVLQQNTRLAYGACGDAATLRAMREAGLDIFWGFIWNLFGDRIDSTGRGCPPQPFYPSDVHIKAAADRGDKPLLGMMWGVTEFLNNFAAGRQNNDALCWAGFNAHDMTNRGGTLDVRQYFTNFWRQLAENTHWNPFVHAPFQIEAHWLDESGNFFAHFPAYTRRTTEMLYFQIESGLRAGAQFITSSTFADWFFRSFDTTPDMLIYLEDSMTNSKLPGKDRKEYGPILIDSNRHHQKIFLRDSGFNPVRTYDYDRVEIPEDPCDEYPYSLEPDVLLQTKRWTAPSYGVNIAADMAEYRTEDWVLTSKQDIPDYTTVLWQANIPENVSESELELSPNIRRLRLIREKNMAIVEASLKQGDNRLCIFSKKPSECIRLSDPDYHCNRIECWIENSGPEVQVSSLSVRLQPHLTLGGFWWDGEYFETLSHYFNSAYEPHTGMAFIRACYPSSYKLLHGSTRLSFEWFGSLGDLGKA